MKILVTGGAGYVGSHTVKELARRGYDIVVYDNLSRGHRWAARWGELVVGELADGARLREVLAGQNIAAVLHFAALAYVGESVADPKRYYENNVANTLSLLNAMLAEKVNRFILSSTCAVYGNPREIPMTEEHPLAPVNPYGRTKLMVETILKDYDESYGMRHVNLRYFNAAGADPDGELGEDHDPETHLIPRVLMAAAGRLERVEVFGGDYPTEDGTCVRDYVHVSDLATAHVLALEWLVQGGASETFNLGTGQGYTVMQVLERARRITGRPIPAVISARRPGDPAVLLASNEKAARVLGWKPRCRSLDEIIASAWSWHQKPRPRVA
ncbi:MAG TPA: UDP-glucose 4-epimerase GalE [Candidatus Acidoferrales bacterium]|nr:UDP-glucose 4-epimerase GalE [Candidatus Acidoferrales bacterium]